ncbi:MAG: lipopolysaccharide heptosyltransferase I [Azospira sp.]|jgi:heptosyltransferase-1|nr:lipopolysaccharide heptosyltransferase I [Azospira sp.]
MRILLVKTSSLGDVIHNLPVAADLARRFPGVEIDWCVEEAFADVPRLSPAVRETIPVAVRRWRKQLFSAATWREIGALRRRLAGGAYDAVLDTQGLLKSALIAAGAGGQRLGHDRDSAREPLAARFYDRSFFIPRELHAVERNRQLAAAAFGYALPPALDYGIAAPEVAAPWLPAVQPALPLAVLLTATSRDDKLWPEADWIALGRALVQRGLKPVLPAGSEAERERAARIAQAIGNDAVVAPPLSIRELAGILGRAKLAVGVDTGLAHLAAALKVPTVALYTATDPALTGVAGAGFARNLGKAGQAPAVAEVLAVADEALVG